MGSYSFLQGVFLIQGSNLGFPHCRQILYHLSHQGSPEIMIVSIYKDFFVANKFKKKKRLEEKRFGEKNGGSKKINESLRTMFSAATDSQKVFRAGSMLPYHSEGTSNE